MERRVLVRLPAEHDARLSARVLGSAHIAAFVCGDEAQLEAELQRGVGLLLVAEEALTPSLLNVLGRYLAAQQAWSDMPVLVLAKKGADSLQAQRAVEHLGNVTLLERPLRTITLISAARSALRARDRQYQARAFSQRKDEFLATLAHELRNPLAPIANAIAIIQRLHPTPQVKPLAFVVERQVSQLKRLVDDLLDVARITSGKLNLQLAETTVSGVLAQALETAQSVLDEKHHRVTVNQPAEEVVLRGDHVRLVQAVTNLLVNAGRFTPPGGHVELEAACDAQHGLAITVRDNGRGIAASDIDRIFDMFEQARTVGEPTGGLGLGLHLTRAIAGLHGGTVHAHSAGLGHGTAFTLRLPIVGTRTSAASPAADAPRALPRKVLVVDDNVDAAGTLASLLELHGVQVALAYDGAAALEKVRSEDPDVVVMDIGMPVMNGYEAARSIRGEALPRQPRLVAVTGWGQFADKQRAAAAGFDRHLVKPLDANELVACLAELSGRPA